jgi:hypothetical protein
MIKYRDSKISAYHNYLVDNLLTPGFVVGDPRSEKGFYFLADWVLPGGKGSRISARFLDEHGHLLLELDRNRVEKNPAGWVSTDISGGFRIRHPSSDQFLEVHTQSFANCYLTRIKARLIDENGDLRIEPSGESIRIHGDSRLILKAPFHPS